MPTSDVSLLNAIPVRASFPVCSLDRPRGRPGSFFQRCHCSRTRKPLGGAQTSSPREDTKVKRRSGIIWTMAGQMSSERVNMILQGMLVSLFVFIVRSQTVDESENVEILDSGTVEGPVAAALVDGEDADIGK